MPYKLSPSKLTTFIDCPLCFWFQEKKKIKYPGIFPSITSGLDSVIKEYMNKYRKRKEIPPFLENKVEGKLVEFLPKSLKCKINGATLTGKLDECLVTENHKHIPLDHKSKGFAPDDGHKINKWYKLQLDCYTLLLKRNHRKVNNIGYIVYYYPDMGELHDGIPFKVSAHKVRTNPKHAIQVIKNAIKCLDGPKPQPSPDCRICNYIEKRNSNL